eukprot:297409_1
MGQSFEGLYKAHSTAKTIVSTIGIITAFSKTPEVIETIGTILGLSFGLTSFIGCILIVCFLRCYNIHLAIIIFIGVTAWVFIMIVKYTNDKQKEKAPKYCMCGRIMKWRKENTWHLFDSNCYTCKSSLWEGNLRNGYHCKQCNKWWCMKCAIQTRSIIYN